MQAGKMKHRLELMKPDSTPDAFGALKKKGGYVKTATVWAERVTLKASEHREAREEFADFSAEFRIRDAHKVGNGWRCRQLGGMLYNITNVIPNEQRGFLTLVCSRVNE
jgi:SPP1 family predicted phage head-tail adaptor